MKTLNSNEKLQQQLEGLSKEISPSRDLWPGIERAINFNLEKNHKQSVINLKPYAWAASAVAAVLLSWTMLKPAQVNETELSVIAMIDKQFQQDRKTMLVSLGQPDLTTLPDEIQQQFTQIASAKSALEKALLADPNNPDLLNLLSWLNQQELSLIEQLYSTKWQVI